VPSDSTSERIVSVPFERIEGWLERFDARHPGTVWDVTSVTVAGSAPDGSWCSFDVPYPSLDDASIDGLVTHLQQPRTTALLLVRKGGFAVARLSGAEVVASKIGQRHVQGRSKAGGWSQQRFARRRENQAREAFEAAASHFEAVVGPTLAEVIVLGTGGDKAAVDAVVGRVSTAVARELATVPQTWLGGYPDPRRATLHTAVRDLRSVAIRLVDAGR
jgi:VLRF1 release factor-like protein